MRNYLFLILSFIFSTSVFGTTYLPVPIKQQIIESSGIVQGEVITTSSEEDENGAIVTKVFLRADKWIGVQPHEQHLEIYYPGGQVGDRVQTVHGAPTFKSGEKVVLMLKNNNEKNWMLNLSLGKFMIKRYGVSEVLINSVFPNHPKVGQMPIESFYELASNIKKVDFKERFKDKYEIQTEKQASVKFSSKGRSIASIDKEKQETENFSPVWLLILLGVMGGVFTLVRSKQNYQ